MRAPPESLIPITGQPILAARSMTLHIFSAMTSPSEPPKTVKSCEKTHTRAAVDRAVAGDDGVAPGAVLLHPELGHPVADERVQLLEGARIQQLLEPLARGQLAAWRAASPRPRATSAPPPRAAPAGGRASRRTSPGSSGAWGAGVYLPRPPAVRPGKTAGGGPGRARPASPVSAASASSSAIAAPQAPVAGRTRPPRARAQARRSGRARRSARAGDGGRRAPRSRGGARARARPRFGLGRRGGLRLRLGLDGVGRHDGRRRRQHDARAETGLRQRHAPGRPLGLPLDQRLGRCARDAQVAERGQVPRPARRGR